MKWMWVLAVLACASCKKKLEDAEPPAPRSSEPAPVVVAPVVAPDAGRDIVSPLPEKGPHPDYPTAAAAGTDKLFFLEEPDRGPKAPTSFTPPAKLTWTDAPSCQIDQLGVVCSKGSAAAAIHYRLGKGAGVTVVEKRRGDRVSETTVFVTGAGGARSQRLHLDSTGTLDEALLFTTPGRFSGRRRNGSNALDGCGLMAFAEDKQHRLAELRCLQWLGEPMRDKKGVALTRFAYDARGFVGDERSFGLDGAPVADATGVHRRAYTRDPAGRAVLSQNYDTEGKRVVDTTGCAGDRYTWGPNGGLATWTCLDVGDAIVKNDDGVAKTTYSYDARGCLTQTRNLGADGAPASDRDLQHGEDLEVNDNCFTTTRTCIDVNGAPTNCANETTAKSVYQRDGHGEVISLKYVNRDGTPGADTSYKVHELRWAYDDVGNNIEISCFDAAGAPAACGATGFHGTRQTYDDAGREVMQTFFDSAGGVATNMQVAQRRFRYDNYDHQYESRNADANGEVFEMRGMAIRHDLYDAAHRLFAILLLDAKGQPASYGACFTGATCPAKPWHAVRINRRASGFVESNQFFDATGQLLEVISCQQKPCFRDD